ncbi:MAG: GNAT family N-acetyltransferase [Pseudomonadota bacterium]
MSSRKIWREATLTTPRHDNPHGIAEAAARPQETGTPAVQLAFDPVQQRWVSLRQIDDSTLAPYLRHWSALDAGDFCRVLDDPRVWEFLPESFPGSLSQGDAAELIKLSNDRSDHIVRAVILGETPVGQVRLDFSADASRRVGEVSYWLGYDYWGRGIMQQVLSRFCLNAFDAEPALLQIEARVHPDNLASSAVLRRSGFSFQEKREDANGWQIFARRRL